MTILRSSRKRNPERPRLTKVEYAAAHGLYCPFCGAPAAEWGKITDEDEKGFVYRAAWCESCGKRWTDVLKLVGYKE